MSNSFIQHQSTQNQFTAAKAVYVAMIEQRLSVVRDKEKEFQKNSLVPI